MLYNEKARILDNREAGANIYLMTLTAPRIAEHAQPGQFVHMRIPGMEGHILRRPFGVYDQDPESGTVEIMYQALGFGTHHMTALKRGDEAELLGPVGHGWTVPDGCKRALIVAGGVGSAPLYPLVKTMLERNIAVDAVLGASTAEALVARDRYEQALGREVLCSTDDGTCGRKGFCTSLVSEALEAAGPAGYDYLACCGPEPLMRIVASMASEAEVPCEVSLEKRMACGVGACLSCVVDTVDGKKRACVDGPVFSARDVLW